MRFDPKETHFSISMSTKTTARFARRTPVSALVSFAPLAIESYRPNQPFFLGFSFAAFPSGALSGLFLAAEEAAQGERIGCRCFPGRPSLVRVGRAQVESLASVELGHADGHPGKGDEPASPCTPPWRARSRRRGSSSLMAAVSSLLNVPFMNPLTLARRFDTSDSMEPRLADACEGSPVAPPTSCRGLPPSLLFWNQPAVTVRPRGRQAAVRATRARSARSSTSRARRGSDVVARWCIGSVTRIELPGCHARDGPSHASLISVSDRPHLRLLPYTTQPHY